MSREIIIADKLQDTMSEVVKTTSKIDLVTLENITEELVVSLVNAIDEASYAIKEGIEYNKQYEKGKIYSKAAEAARLPKSKVTIKSLCAKLEIPERTFYEQIKFFVDRTDFKKILRVTPAQVAQYELPSSGVSRVLKGNTASDRIAYHEKVGQWGGKQPTNEGVRAFTKIAKEVATETGCEVFEVTVEQVRAYEPEDEEEPEKVKPTPAKTPAKPQTKVGKFKALPIAEQINATRALYKERTGYDVNAEFEAIPDEKKEPISSSDRKTMIAFQNEWKAMYRKGSKCFHSDHGGDDNEMVIWKIFANIIENVTYNSNNDEAQQVVFSHATKAGDIPKEEVAEWYL